jgi:hypothetical protein
MISGYRSEHPEPLFACPVLIQIILDQSVLIDQEQLY